MVKLINAVTGTDMWIEDSRVEEYLKLGHERPKAETPAKKKGEPEGAEAENSEAGQGDD